MARGPRALRDVCPSDADEGEQNDGLVGMEPLLEVRRSRVSGVGFGVGLGAGSQDALDVRYDGSPTGIAHGGQVHRIPDAVVLLALLAMCAGT
ncbi:hypothetical protein [Streptomyces sp. IMTB 1903]|uniref:hypothetical protein n=1 Tax=Streptomyces sp. IMTB 1903 TaxID=1776680 RepID=UPI001F15A0E2|nr:hypothetical protein [Streptomyces sp. IMTB 1903]